MGTNFWYKVKLNFYVDVIPDKVNQTENQFMHERDNYN